MPMRWRAGGPLICNGHVAQAAWPLRCGKGIGRSPEAIRLPQVALNARCCPGTVAGRHGWHVPVQLDGENGHGESIGVTLAGGCADPSQQIDFSQTLLCELKAFTILAFTS